MRSSLIRSATLLALLCLSTSVAMAADGKRDETDPCASLRPAAAGGPVPRDDEKLVVLGQVEGDDALLRIGAEAEHVLSTLFEDDEGEHMVWKWKVIS